MAKTQIMWAEESVAHYAQMAQDAGVEGSARFETRYHLARTREHFVTRDRRYGQGD